MLKFLRVPALGAAIAIAAIGGTLALQKPIRTLAANQTVAWSVPTSSSVTVSTGDTVTWDWSDALPHSVTTVSGPATFDSTVLTGADQTFAFTFTQAGTYTYRCVVHPDGMNGTVVVQAAQASPTAVPPTTAATTVPTTAATVAPTSAAPTTPLAGARTITLTGAEEVPPVTSPATGSFQWKLEGQSLSYVLKATGTSMTMAHIHIGDKGANGPVVAFLFGPNQAGVNSIDVAGTISVAQLSGSLAGDMAGFIAALNRGGLYVNVHSIANPAGVVRGQIPAATPPGVPSTGTGALGSEEGGNTFGLPLAILAAAVLSGGIGMTILNRRRQRAS